MKHVTLIIAIALVLLAISGCGSNTSSNISTGKEIKSAKAGDLTVTLSNERGQLEDGNEEFYLTFKDGTGKPVDVGAVALNFHMPAMGSMPVMNDPATFTTTGTPGVYKGKAMIEMAGEWQAQVTYEGPAGKGQVSFPVTAY
jgi:hypothetical protein